MDDTPQSLSWNGRPIKVASFGDADGAEPHVPLRSRFPEAGEDYLGGSSDGYEYKSVFAGTSLEHSYGMVRAFLLEEGYADVPLPADVQELEAFRLQTRNKQVLLFEDNGYVHNPVKILFPLDRRKKSTLILCLYNEAAPKHLLRFHGKLR